MGYSIQRHLEYNAWANGKIVEFMKSVDDRLLDKELKSSFSTIRKTFYHIWDAEIIWLKRVKGESVTTWPSEISGTDGEDSFSEFLKNSQELVQFVSDKKRDFLDSKITYTNIKGNKYTNVIEDVLFHVVNHGTFHRGQMVTMLRELGCENFEAQDLIAYLRQQQTITQN